MTVIKGLVSIPALLLKYFEIHNKGFAIHKVLSRRLMQICIKQRSINERKNYHHPASFKE
jgi:hypothetical protein